MALYVDYLSNINRSATIRRRINSLGTILKLSENYDHINQPEVILAIKECTAKFGWHSSKLLHLPSRYTTSYLATAITVSGV
jgi:hypothetical protein